MNWLLLNRTLDQIGFFCTLISQSTVIILTVFFVKRDFGAYKYLIISFSATGIVFAAFGCLLCPMAHSFNDGFILLSSNSFPTLPIVAQRLLFATYAAFFGVTLSIIAIQYIYRYAVVLEKKYLKYFRGWRTVTLLGYTTWMSFQWAAGIFIFLEADGYSISIMAPVMREVYGIDIEKTGSFISVTYETYPGNEKIVRWWNLMASVDINVIMLIQYSIMAYCGYRLYKDMDEKLQMVSEHIRNIHRQVFKTLVLQIILPTLFLFSPVVFMVLVPLFDLKLSIPTGAILSGFAFYPALDAAILIWCIKDFRKALIALMHCRKVKVEVEVVAMQSLRVT